ncbi:MAG: 3'-5' exonuclease [Psychromonas sp.]|nr:3'-5' exonuclease [Psychromonas sp.]
MNNFIVKKSKKYVNNEILNWSAFLRLKKMKSQDTRLKYFYQQGTYNEETPLSDIQFLALDFETTGLDVDQNSIISIGLVPFTLSKIFCKDSKHWYIRPQDKLEENTVIIHGITHSDLTEAPSLEGILVELLDHLKGKVIVVHYRNIEREFLHNNLYNLIGEGIIFPVIDTMQIEADLKQIKNWSLRKWFSKPNVESIRLANSRKRYNLPEYSAHNALIDAIATAELLQAQIKYHFSPDTQIKKLWI